MVKRAPSMVADPARKANRKASVRIWRRLMSASVLLMLVIATPGTLLVLFFTMLPTSVAFMVDPSRGKYAALSVGGMNFAAAFPVLLNLWLHGHSVSAAGAALTDVFAMTVIYMAAAFGWSLHLGIPVIASAIRQVTGIAKVARLRMRQQQLVDAWGHEVAQPPNLTPP